MINDFAYGLGHTLCSAAEVAVRLCDGRGDYLMVGFFTMVFLSVLSLVWLLLR